MHIRKRGLVFGLKRSSMIALAAWRTNHLAVSALTVMVLASAFSGPAAAKVPADPLSMLGLRATQGAAPGYVQDDGCRRCHPVKFDSFQHVGMSQSMRRPSSEVMIEDFENNHFYHAPSKRHYEMHWDGTTLRFERYQLADDGQPINSFETRVDWIVGSGNKARSYIYRTPGGELFQLPIGWYTQESAWGMSPGFELAGHLGVNRTVRRECLFCHNAYPEVAAGSDQPGRSHEFPADLPEGIGCQRCHGPGADHIRSVLLKQPRQAIREAIVNPAGLAPARRDDVCNQCHLLPSVSMIGIRRFDRADYSFRPGQSLFDYVVHVDVDVAADNAEETGQEQVNAANQKFGHERFEINHHAYRLRQSSCFQQSDQALSCLSCHDPHRKLARPAARDHFRDACLQCHQRHDELPDAGRLTDDPDDCVACHMPQRRTDDVVKVTMTDHRIAAGPFDTNALTAPKVKTIPIIEKVNFYLPEHAPQGALAELYRAITVLRTGFDAGAMRHLANQLGRVQLESAVPFLELAKAQIADEKSEPAIATLNWLLDRRPDTPVARELLGLAYLKSGNLDSAANSLEAAMQQTPADPETLHNLALARIQQGKIADAVELLERALALRPNMATSWYYHGKLQHQLERTVAAERSLRRALGVDPTHSRAYQELTQVLRALGKDDEANRVLVHGLSHADDPDLLKELREEDRSSNKNASPDTPL